MKRRVKLLPVPFKDENAIRLVYEGEEIKPNERFLPKYNEVIHLIGVRRIAESGLQFEDFPICGLKSVTNGNGSYTIDGYKVQTPSGGRRVEILQILKEGLNLDLEIIFPEKDTASSKKEGVILTIDGNKFKGKKLKDCFAEALKYCGLKKVYDLHLKYNPNPNSKEYFDILDNAQKIGHHQVLLEEDGLTYYMHINMRDFRKKEILSEICERLGLELSFEDAQTTLMSSFSVEYQGTTYQEKDDKSTVMEVMRQIGIDRIKAECVGTKIIINKVEHPLISNTKVGYTHYIEFEEEGCYVACSRFDRRKVLDAIEKTMHLGLIINELKDEEE